MVNSWSEHRLRNRLHFKLPTQAYFDIFRIQN